MARTLHRSLAPLHALRGRARRLLAVFAHPDDESYGCSGALARTAARSDAAVVLLSLTRGEASTMFASEGLDGEAIGHLREGRLEQVAARLGLEGLLVPGLPDGRLARVSIVELGRTVGDVIDAFDPQVVIGHDARGVNGHPDHIASHWAIRRALETRPRRFAQIAYLEDTVEAVKPRLLFATPVDDIDAVLDLDAPEIDAKEDCLRIHEALVTIKPDGPEGLLRRPPVERFDFLGERVRPLTTDLFVDLD